MVEPEDHKRETEDASALSRALRETSLSEEPSTAGQSSTVEPKMIPVEELADHYNSTKPPGRKYLKQSESDWENLYIDGSREDLDVSTDEDNTMKSEGKAGENKQAAKITGTKGKKSQVTKQSRSKAEVKAEMMSQPSSAKGKKAKGKEKKTGESEDEEDGEKKEKKWTPPRYNACNECHTRRIRCYGADKKTKSDDWLCTPCRRDSRECHFSVIGLRHLSAKK